MKLTTILTISILLSACGTTSSQNEQSEKVDESWEMTDHTFTSNTYNSRGLPDSNHEMMYMYLNGMLFDSVESIVIRRYDNDKMTSEKEFTLSKDGIRALSSEIIEQYGATGNLITEINKFADFFSKTICEYNNKGLAIKWIHIYQKMADHPSDYNLDSAVAHRNDKKLVEYDTTLHNAEYDLNNNLIRVVISDTKGTIQETKVNQYSGHEKIFSCSITPQGDTTRKFIYTHEGNFVKEIADMRNRGRIDTTWWDKEKIIRSISYDDKRKIKYKRVYSYNNNGDEIEDVSYKQTVN